MIQSKHNPGQIPQSVRSQNNSDDLSMMDLKQDSISQQTEVDYALGQHQDISKIHSSFLKSISIIFTVVIVVFIILSVLAYQLVVHLQSSHGDHYFDVEPFESMHPLFADNNILYTVRSEPRKRTPPVSKDLDKYEFQTPVARLVKMADFQTDEPNSKEMQIGILKSAITRSSMLMDLVHNVNFYGQFVFDHYYGFQSARQKAQHFANLLTEERAFLNSKYQIDKYIHDQIGMCVFVPSFNNAKNRLYLRNLDSIFQQNYKNYHLVYVNDASSDGTGEYVQAYMDENLIPPEKYLIINNQKSRFHCANIYNVAHNHCEEGQILVMLDGDDSLIGRNVFALLNAVYHKQKVALTYGQFIVVRNFTISVGWSRPIPRESLENGEFRKLKDFYSSHLKTMYVDLFRKINASDLQYKNGSFYGYAPDVAYMTPAIQMAGTRLAFINEASYEYRFDTGMNENAAGQMDVYMAIFQKKPYQTLSSMDFAGNPKIVHYDEV